MTCGVLVPDHHANARTELGEGVEDEKNLKAPKPWEAKVDYASPSGSVQLPLSSTPKRRKLDFNSIATPVKVRRVDGWKQFGSSHAEVVEEVKRLPENKKPLKVVGPSIIQTLRGRLQGREVAVLFCGESHEDTIDLTRRRGVVAAEEGWIAISPRCFDPRLSFAQRDRLTVRGAQRWADEVLADTGEDVKILGAHLVFEPQTRTRGSARVFLPSVLGTGEDLAATPSVQVFRFGDLDEEADQFNQRRLKEDRRDSVEQQDALIAGRKRLRQQQGFELFDDWLLRQVESESVHVEVVLEAPVKADELELTITGEAPLPPAHACLETMAEDSEEDSDEASTPGAGSYLDFLRRRFLSRHHSRLHGVDPRGLGDAEDEHLPKNLQGSYNTLRGLTSNGEVQEPLPSWEAFFGGAADLLYYAPHVKADYTPFLKSCVGSAENMRHFFQKLFFTSVPEALSLLRLDEETKSCCHLRAPQRPEGRCASGRRTLPVRAAPLQRYLTARGCDVPRTWIAGMAQRLRQKGATKLVDAAQQWYTTSVDRMLRDPKGGDPEGDNFAAWLRACHRHIYRDIDTYDCAKLKRSKWAQSKSKKKRYNLKDIKIPSVEQAFKEFRRRSTSRQEVLSKIMVDIFQLRSVDLAMILKSIEVASAAPEGAKVVLVCYGGLDHTRNVAKFFKSKLGFSSRGLRNGGRVGKEEYDEEEKRTLTLPPYLQNLQDLFPVPASLKEAWR